MSSSIPGRSDSQRSYTKGDDEISVRKLTNDDECEVEGRKSGVSLRTESSSSPSFDNNGDKAPLHDSCALKHFSKHKSSHLRFLAWVAYTRKFANEAITDEERRTCPLLWCRQVFNDQESMLQHVWNCPHLSKGLYWCYHCQKHERLGKFHKRCTGLPSKSERIATVAKKIFSRLGASTHRKGSRDAPPEESFSVKDCWRSTDEKRANLYQDFPPQWDFPANIQELPDTSVPAEMAADISTLCQEMPDTSIIEMMNTDMGNVFGIPDDIYTDNFYSETFDDAMVPPPPRPRAATPKLWLDTSMSPLHRGEWKGPVQTYQPAPQPSLDDIVSPMSAVGTYNANSVDIEISPTNTEASGVSFFSDSGYTSATTADTGSNCPSRMPSLNEPKVNKRSWDHAVVPEQHYSIDAVAPLTFPVTLPDFEQAINDSLFSTPSVSRSSSKASEKAKARDLSQHWNDASTLVQSFSEVLDEHISHSQATLGSIPANSVTLELLGMSKSSIMSKGLEALSGVLQGRPPSSVSDVFALTHIAGTCAIVMNQDAEIIQSDEWFQDSMACASRLPEQQLQRYTQIATSIWKSQPPSGAALSVQASRPFSRANQLLQACQRFLDVLEYLDNDAKAASAYQTPNSGLDFVQLSFEHRATTSVINKLITITTIEAFIDDVVAVGRKLTSGRIRTVRGLELELICAGKMSSRSDTAYFRFLDHVTRLCNQLYNQEPNSSTSRITHQVQDVALLRQYLPDQSQVDAAQLLRDFDINFDEDFGFDYVSASAEGDILGGMAYPSPQSSFHPTPLTQSTPSTSSFTPNSNHLFPSSTPLPTFSFHSPTPPHAFAQASSSQSPNHAFHLSTSTPHTSTPPPRTVATSSRPPSAATSTTSTSSPFPPPPSSTSTPPVVERYRCHCGFVPTGEERWKPSNLRRHKRTQHPDLENGGTARVWRCHWRGCTSSFTRSDNLRSHQRARGHGAFSGAVEGVNDGNNAGGKAAKRRRMDDGRNSGSNGLQG